MSFDTRCLSDDLGGRLVAYTDGKTVTAIVAWYMGIGVLMLVCWNWMGVIKVSPDLHHTSDVTDGIS